MTTARNIILGVIALALLGLGFILARPLVLHPTGAVSPVGHQDGSVNWFSNILYFGSTQQAYFDASGNLVTSSSITENGITTTVVRSTSLNQASTTPCGLSSPTSTSTLESFTGVTSATTTASLLTLATSTTAFATTSLIATRSIASGAQGLLDWHPGNQNSVISPSTYVVMGQSGGTGTFSPTGSCSAVFQSI